MLTTKNHTMKKFTLFTLALFLLQTFSAVSADNIVTFYHNDVLGSPVAATDSNGNKIWEEQYHPYGERRLKQNPANENDIWYTGKPHDEETGLTYLGARYYDPVVGRFMAIDPVGFREGNIHSFNRFAYANNNPYGFVDPDGDVPVAPIIYFIIKEVVATAAEEVTGVPLSTRGILKKGLKKTVRDSPTSLRSAPKEASPNVKKVLDGIEQNGFKVKVNPRNPATKQEGNVTIDFGDKTKVNLRVESHPLKQNGSDVRHANVEVTRQVKNKNKVISNKHIIDN